MRYLLLTVERTFTLLPGVTTLSPDLPMDALPSLAPRLVTLKRPDGLATEALARFGTIHYNRPYSERTIENTWRLSVSFASITQEDVPPGTEVWIELP